MFNFYTLLQNYLSSNHKFKEEEKLLEFRFRFFNTMLLPAVFFPPLISYFHSFFHPFLVYSDNAFALISIAIIFLLRQNKNRLILAGNIFIPILFITITLAFFLSGDDASKITGGPILFACAFILQGSRAGFLWFALTISSYFIGYFIDSHNGKYFTLQELSVTTIMYFTMSIIFSAFLHKTNSDNRSFIKINQDLAEKSDELVDFNNQLECRIDEALKENQNKTQSIQRHLNMINEHIITVSIGIYGLITNVSSAYCRISQYKKHTLIGTPFTKIFATNTSILELKAIWKSLEKGEVYKGEISNVSKEDNRYWLDLTISPEYSSTGELIGYISIARDITDKKLIMQQHEQLITQSRHAAMGEMISMITHQWRQPLSSITAATSNLILDIELDKYSPEKAKQSLKNIDTQVFHLSSTVEDFRDFFKPSKGIENTYIHLLIQDALKLLEYRLKEDIKIVFQERVELSLSLYKNELIQVLINIFNNAKDAFEEKGIREGIITINEYIENESVVIEIEDNAGGIDEESLEYIFNPYFSTKSATGTGLGLHMSKTIVEEHQQGKLEAFNRGLGAVFKLSIPLATCQFNAH